MFHDITWFDLDFDRIPVEFYSARGVPQIAWTCAGMPRIPQKVINGVFYLYRDRDDAESGRNAGGTGFLVAYDGNFPARASATNHFYGVTNWHVACSGGYSTIRLNTKDGGTDIIELGPEEWHFLPGKYDVAVVPLVLDETIHDVSAVATTQFAEENNLYGPQISVGDDTFMIGLFVDHGGVTSNIPSARFGNISMLPNQKATIKQPTGLLGESFVVDMHSRTGFSGSPVYVYRTFGADLTEWFGSRFESVEFDNLEFEPPRTGTSGGSFRPVQLGRVRTSGGRLRASTLFKLLGIHWGQFPERWELHELEAHKELPEARKDLILEGAYVKGLSGMTTVIPAWHIKEVLDMPTLRDQRQSKSKVSKREDPSVPIAESVPSSDGCPPASSSDKNPNHREDFNSLVNAAAQKREQED